MRKNSINEIIIFNEDFFSAILADIQAATKTIDISIYMYQADEVGYQLAEALCNAASRGVKVRLLTDGIGSLFWNGTLSRKLEDAGVEVRIYHPLPVMIWHWGKVAHVPEPFMKKLIYLFANANSRNHRKLWMVDQKITYVSSLNISKQHLSKTHDGDGWRDTTVKIIGANLNYLQFLFERSWERLIVKLKQRPLFAKNYIDPVFNVNYTRWQRKHIFKSLIADMNHCKKRIWITNAYFIPNTTLQKTLINAAKRGIDVRILLPSTSDVLITSIVANTFYTALLTGGVKIFEYLPSMLHAKSLIIDDWHMVGSTNLNSRSLKHDLEVDVKIQTSDAKQILEKQFLNDLQHSKKVQLEDLKKQPLLKKWLGKLLLFFRHWI